MNKIRISLIAITIVLGLIACQKEDTITTSGVEIIEPKGNESYMTSSSDYIFDENVLHTFEINLPEEALAYLDADPAEEAYVEGSLTFNGETLSPIGIRYKGSIGGFIGGVSGDNWFKPSGHKISTKLSMKIKIDWKGYNSIFYGLKKLQFYSMRNEPTQMHERLGYWLFRAMGVPAPRAVHAKLIINGTYSGVYTLVEQIDEQFTTHSFSGGNGNLYKEIWPLDSDGNVQSQKKLCRALVTNRNAGVSVNRMVQFAQAVIDATDIDLKRVIENNMDVDEIIAYVVVDRLIRNDDGAFHWYCKNSGCAPHNYFWYENPESNKLHLIPWDLDDAFGNIIDGSGPVTPIADAWGEKSGNCQPYRYGSWGIVQKSAACDKLTDGWTGYTDKYNQLKTELINGPASEGIVNNLIDQWSDQIRAATIEAHELHDDALSISEWESAIQALKDQLDYARVH